MIDIDLLTLSYLLWGSLTTSTKLSRGVNEADLQHLKELCGSHKVSSLSNLIRLYSPKVIIIMYSNTVSNGREDGKGKKRDLLIRSLAREEGERGAFNRIKEVQWERK